MSVIYYANQYFTTTLNVVGGIDASQTTGIILTSVSGVDTSKPGIALINYTDPLDTDNAEWVTYTSIDGSNELQGVTRGAEGFSAKSHANGVNIAFPVSESHINNLADSFGDGWVWANETWTFATDDDPTYTLTISGDKTSKYSAGMRVKLTDSGTQYFIITKVAYSSPNTTLTLYGGTDYDLSGGAITNPYYSTVKAPQGLPLNPNKWMLELSNESTDSQAPASLNTWYNLGGSLDIHIGCWNVEYYVSIKATNDQSNLLLPVVSTLSTANNSESDSEFTVYTGHRGSPASPDTTHETIATHNRMNTLDISSKTTYYLNVQQTITSTIDSLAVRGDYSATVIRARCTYL